MPHRSPPKVAMKSSGSVFTTQNPFPPASKVRRAHYHPSRNQPLSKNEKKTTLSPVRLNHQPRTQLHALNRERQQLTKKHGHFSSIDGQPVLAESRPSTVFGPSPGINTASSDMEEPKQSAGSGESTVFQVLGGQEDSVLAKYIKRFRHGRPQSRDERQQVASASGEEQVPFWWMSDSSPTSSTPTKTEKDVVQPLKEDQDPAIYSPSAQCHHNRTPSPCRGSSSLLSDTSQVEFDDMEILHLQEKASRLLLRGECSVSDGSIPVSSEGLGCSDFSSPISIDEPVKQPLIPSFIKNTIAKASSDSAHAVSSQKSVIPSLVPPTHPEEDILFQWRLRRKMEQAREQPLSVQASSPYMFSRQVPKLSYPSVTEQVHKEQQGTQPPQFSQRDAHPHITAPQPETTEAHRSSATAPPFPATAVSGSVFQPQSIAHVPAHMHLLCDVLPCPIQSSHTRTHQSISQRLDESQTKVAHKKTQVPESSTNKFRDLPLCEHVSFTPPTSSEREWPDHQKICERNRQKRTGTESEMNGKKQAVPIRQQKKSARSSSNQKHPKKVTSCKEQQQPERSQEFPSKGCAGHHGPPQSPIHSALGQVVSEVLFPTVHSSPAQRVPVLAASPPSAVSAPSQSPAPLSNALNSMEVISQLLQEAEDSDEKEFEDDPLLQVLRKQRKWVKEQIGEVDSILDEFLEKQQVT